jgi:hypothetical protein
MFSFSSRRQKRCVTCSGKGYITLIRSRDVERLTRPNVNEDELDYAQVPCPSCLIRNNSHEQPRK